MNLKKMMIFFLFSSVIYAQQYTIDAKDWANHPARYSIRIIVSEIDSLYRSNQLKVISKYNDHTQSYDSKDRDYYIDQYGKIRKYVEQYGSDDSYIKVEHYYDSNLSLRFVFINGGAVNGSVLKHRIYFDEKVKRIWESHEYVKGPGYTFEEKWPDDQLVFEPKIDN